MSNFFHQLEGTPGRFSAILPAVFQETAPGRG